MEPAYGFHSLFNFKRKFQPAEAPVYVCYPDCGLKTRGWPETLSALTNMVKAAQNLRQA